ncbi:MAG: Crp/Fnr family transcriptional regulator [Cytophagales bacterium]|nr:Crp/Fnr family transcriptional regulator [Cytophagales bacterium]
MEALQFAMQQMINISEEELDDFLSRCFPKKLKRKEVLSRPQTYPNEVFFIVSGIVRVSVLDKEGNEHSIHFALENQFICDYSAFMRKEHSLYTLEALEETEVIVLPRNAIEWGYSNLTEGDKMGRLIAEFYFIYQDNRIKNQYTRTPKERYDTITEVFPNIHNRVPQHMIASYLGITSIHLSRLKKQDLNKT